MLGGVWVDAGALGLDDSEGSTIGVQEHVVRSTGLGPDGESLTFNMVLGLRLQPQGVWAGGTEFRQNLRLVAGVPSGGAKEVIDNDARVRLSVLSWIGPLAHYS